MSSVRHFKKYANRKFYDADRGKYVSVRDITSVVKKGGAVEVTSDRTGQDLTHETLARILYEEVKAYGKRKGLLGISKYDMPLRSVQLSNLIKLFTTDPPVFS